MGSAEDGVASCRSGYERVYAKAAVLSRASNRTAEPSSGMERGASSLKMFTKKEWFTSTSVLGYLGGGASY
jgi:hypothetical protein